MKPAYDRMIQFLDAERNRFGNRTFEQEQTFKLNMIWQNALDVDFTKLNYDFVLTSPPYVNLELYEHMEPWQSDESFYKQFFIPLWKKCIDNIQPGGNVAFNISPKMYEDALTHGLMESHLFQKIKVCDEEEDLKQQLGQQTGKKKQDKIYVWKC